MIKTIISVFKAIFSVLKLPLYCIGALVVLFFLCVMIQVICLLLSGKRFKKGVHIKIKKSGFFYRLLIQAPRRYAADLLDRNPEFFRYQGCVCFTGRQGMGKTIAMVHQTMQYQLEYPKVKVISNCGYAKQDTELKHWRQLMDYKNGIQGVVVQMDEMQNWFSSNQSKNFPPEMLEVICQNRKNRRIILGTAQVFVRLAKPLREQVTEVRRCTTFLGCITVVHRVRPELDSDGNVTKWKHIGFYFFVHTQEIRDAYDTYRVIESLSKSGFQERLPETKVVNYVSTK